VDVQLGGLCWSKQVATLMRQRGLFGVIESKLFLLNKFSLLGKLCFGALSLATLAALVLFFLPVRALCYSSIVLATLLMLGLIISVNITNLFYYHTEMTIALVITLLIFLLNIYFFKSHFKSAIKYLS
jgi:hypothetical protein